MQLTPRGLLLLSITALFLLAATFAPIFLWLAGIWLVLACALLLADWQLTPPAAWELRRSHDDRLFLTVGSVSRKWSEALETLGFELVESDKG